MSSSFEDLLVQMNGLAEGGRWEVFICMFTYASDNDIRTKIVMISGSWRIRGT